MTAPAKAGAKPTISLDPQELVPYLLSVFKSTSYRPPVLPVVALELLGITRQPDVSIEQVTKLLEKDALVAANVMRIAGSTLYSRGKPPQSLHQAVMRLGLKTLTGIVFQAAMSMRVFRAPGFQEPLDRMRKHSTAVAHVNRALFNRLGMPDDFAYLSGLLHDVGMAASMIVLGELAQRGKAISFADVWPSVLQVHEQAGAALCELWQLPEGVRRVVAKHHPTDAESMDPLCATICVSEAIADKLGLGMENEFSEASLPIALEQLELEQPAFDALMNDVREALSEIQ